MPTTYAQNLLIFSDGLLDAIRVLARNSIIWGSAFVYETIIGHLAPHWEVSMPVGQVSSDETEIWIFYRIYLFDVNFNSFPFPFKFFCVRPNTI